MFITPREYQIRAHDTMLSYLDAAGGNPIIAMPTGTGKSVNIAMAAYQFIMHGKPRTLILTHVKELIRQNSERLLSAWPDAPISIFSAGLRRKELGEPILFAGIASIANVIDDTKLWVDQLLIDECHLISPHGDTVYRTVINKLLEINPKMRIIGYTATPYRMGQGLLTDYVGDNRPLFTDLAVNMTGMDWFNWFISQAYLSNLVTKATRVVLDTSGVGTNNGDFRQGELIEKLSLQDKEHERACIELASAGQDRRKWLVFTAGIERAEWVANRLTYMGIPSTFVHSKTDPKDRDNRIAEYRAGEWRCMCGNNIFTTGFDDPEIDLIGMLRPTKSTPMWVQMLGRGTRPLYAPGYDVSNVHGRFMAMQAGGKRNCLVLDFAKNTPTLGPVNDPRLPGQSFGGGDLPVKICEHCGTYNFLGARVCFECGEPFPPSSKLTAEAYAGEIISTEQAVAEWFKVNTVIYRVHQKGGSRPCVRVTYDCGFRQFDEWLFIEDPKGLGTMARKWWITRLKDPNDIAMGPPPTAQLFVEHQYKLKRPIKVEVYVNHKPYPEVLHYEYE